jgi:hypothetical protein
MARAVSRIRGATAIIVPYDIESRITRGENEALEDRAAGRVGTMRPSIPSFAAD